METSIFARTLKQWFAQNRWAQSITEKVARAKNSPIGPWASQISHAMNAKHTPQPNFFVAMGWFNMIIATRDFVGITDRRVLDKLKDSQPMCHENGEPYEASDFFKLYTGLINPSEQFMAISELTQEDVDHWQNEIQLAFREIVKELCEPTKEVWKAIRTELVKRNCSPDDIDWAQEIILGLRTASLDEAQRQRHKYSNMPLLEAMNTVAGGNQERLGKLQKWLYGKANKFPEAFPRAGGSLTDSQLDTLTRRIRSIPYNTL